MERKRPLRIPPPRSVPVHVGAGATSPNLTLEGLGEHTGFDSPLPLDRKRAFNATAGHREGIKVPPPPIPASALPPVAVVPAQPPPRRAPEPESRFDRQQGISLPHDEDEEVIIEQARVADPDALAELPLPDFSAVSPDPAIHVPRRLTASPRRLAEITATFAKHGLAYANLRLLGEDAHTSFARRLRMAFEELGPTFVKLGQMIASSPGVFPRAISDEFLKCLDSMPAFPMREADRILREDLGDRWSSMFRKFEPVPFAAASIAQVHHAVLADGTPVVVKIQRPGIRRLIERDVGILFLMARILEKRFENAHLANPTGIVADFNQTLHEELDFRLEANSMERFNAVFSTVKDGRIRAAKVYRALCGRRVLVMERLDGARVDDLAAVKKLGADPVEALRVGIKAVLRTLMLHGFFHGDVHAGNLLISKESGVLFMDFGIVGRVDEERGKLITHLLVSMMTGLYENLSDVLLKLSDAPEKANRHGLAEDMRAMMRRFRDIPLGEVNFGDLLTDIVRLAVSNNVRLPRELILIIKQMVYFDRYSHLLAPDYNLFNDRFVVDFLWRDTAGRKKYPQLQMVGMLENVASLRDVRKNKRKSFNELPERYRGRYRYWDGTPLAPNELQCPVCYIVVIAKRPFQAGDKVFCQPCGTRMIVVEKEGKLTAEPIYSPVAQASFVATEGLQDLSKE